MTDRQETSAVDVLALEDEFKFPSSTEATIPYRRIVEIYIPDGNSGRNLRLNFDPSTPDVDGRLTETSITLPSSMVPRLEQAAKEISQGKAYDCHHFTRVMVPRFPNERNPILADRQKAVALPLGAVGLICAEDFGVMHSLLSLGPEKGESLQVMSYRSELGVADNRAVLEWYRKHYLGFYPQLDPEVIDLYELAA